jgi:uncharacterized lipoprotein YajG
MKNVLFLLAAAAMLVGCNDSFDELSPYSKVRTE